MRRLPLALLPPAAPTSATDCPKSDELNQNPHPPTEFLCYAANLRIPGKGEELDEKV
jgi:hypothetical protein